MSVGTDTRDGPFGSEGRKAKKIAHIVWQLQAPKEQQTTYLQIKFKKDELRECEGSRGYRFELQYSPTRVETCSRFLDIDGGSEGGKIRQNFN